MPINDNHQTTTQRYIEIDGQQIPVTEEVYRAYKRRHGLNTSARNVKNAAVTKTATAAPATAASATNSGQAVYYPWTSSPRMALR